MTWARSPGKDQGFIAVGHNANTFTVDTVHDKTFFHGYHYGKGGMMLCASELFGGYGSSTKARAWCEARNQRVRVR